MLDTPGICDVTAQGGVQVVLVGDTAANKECHCQESCLSFNSVGSTLCIKVMNAMTQVPPLQHCIVPNH